MVIHLLPKTNQYNSPVWVFDVIKKKHHIFIIASFSRSDELAGWEDLGEDDDVKAGVFDDDAIDEDNDIIANRNARSRARRQTSQSRKDPADVTGTSPLGTSPGTGIARTTTGSTRSSTKQRIEGIAQSLFIAYLFTYQKLVSSNFARNA